nr:MAG TPA: hypothetical protein [Inoviridae sp.]
MFFYCSPREWSETLSNFIKFVKKEAINPPTGGFLRFNKNYDKISP